MAKLTVAAIYSEYQRAISAIDRLVEAGMDINCVSLVMPDREAERHFTAGARMRLGSPLPLSPEAIQVAQNLAPLAALGTRGTGLVASGPLVSGLVAAGVGAGGGLRRGLTALGVPPKEVELAVAKIRNSGLLVAVETSDPIVRNKAQEVLAPNSVMQVTLKTKELSAKPTLRQPATEDRKASLAELLRMGQQLVPAE